ncbi:PH domain-containing protein [Bacillus suaedaesalsae]|uniref:PH domain-containing protein n=1 Tax=Bacillus suaedaesalsae TaxID=2810349 RepID=A0ABS2DGV1_9BACI|nr:PH domain-containing protein [Bacillus suaedaesalsae]MBM6617705.1 PH domain-containing protein [Bacillus suaedaesalsae]
MRKEPTNSLNKRALTAWRISWSISMGILLLLAIAVLSFVIIFDFPRWIGILTVIAVIILSIFYIVIYPKLQWKKWKYEVHEAEVDIQHGVFLVKRTLIPMVRVQHVDTQQGPLLRKFRLKSVTISTAATMHEIPALDEEEADLLRDRISSLARVDEDE